MATRYDKVFVGGRGRVFALEKATGTLLWETILKEGFFKTGNDLVSLLEGNDHVWAFSYGTLYRLAKLDGTIEWQTHIPHLKHHVGLLAVDGMSNSGDIGISCEGDSDADGDGGDGGDGGGD